MIVCVCFFFWWGGGRKVASQVLFKVCIMFTNTKYVSVHFMYSFCNRNDTAAVADYQ